MLFKLGKLIGIAARWLGRIPKAIFNYPTRKSHRMPDEANSAPQETFKIVLNYSKWFPAEPGCPPQLGELSADSALEWICRTLQPPILDVLKARYQKIHDAEALIALFPNDELLVEKLLIPIHQAKVAFVTGNEIGCIALCGMVGEMLTIFRFRISRYGHGPGKLSGSRQQRLFGSKVEDARQAQRIGILELLGLIDEATAELFHSVKDKRNKYLHRLSQQHDNLSRDAENAYRDIVSAAQRVFGADIQGSKLSFSPDLVEYLKWRKQAPAEPDAGAP